MWLEFHSVCRFCSGDVLPCNAVWRKKVAGLATTGQLILGWLPSFTLVRLYLAHFPPPRFFSFFARFNVSPGRFQRAASRNPGPRNGWQEDKRGELPPSFDIPGAGKDHPVVLHRLRSPDAQKQEPFVAKRTFLNQPQTTRVRVPSALAPHGQRASTLFRQIVTVCEPPELPLTGSAPAP